MYEIIAELLGLDISEINRDTSPANCRSWDSLTHLRMITRICEKYEISLPVSEIVKLKTVGDIQDMLRKQGIDDER